MHFAGLILLLVLIFVLVLLVVRVLFVRWQSLRLFHLVDFARLSVVLYLHDLVTAQAVHLDFETAVS